MATSEPGSLNSKDLNIREKSLLKRNINKHHNSNTRAGYVPVHEESLHKTGLRGRKTYLFWGLIGLLTVLAWSNTILTVILFRVLRIGWSMESIELVPDAGLVRFNGQVDLGSIYKPDGILEGFKNEPMEITAQRSQISFEVEDNRGVVRNMMHLEHNGTEVGGISHFEIIDPKTGNSIFSTTNPTFDLPEGVRNMNARLVKTKRISSSTEDKLVLKGDSRAILKGVEGTRIEGKDLTWSADQTLQFKSTNGTISLIGTKGLDITGIPVVTNTGHALVAQYKVCICMPHGKLFRVPATTDVNASKACSRVEQTMVHNPCK